MPCPRTRPMSPGETVSDAAATRRYGLDAADAPGPDVRSSPRAERFDRFARIWHVGRVMTRVQIYTDGACSGNPGPGGWGAVLAWGSHRREISGGDPDTTNNRMELMAAIRALEALKRPVSVDLHTDSTYLRNGITSWIRNWERRGWTTAAGKPVRNTELWRRLQEAALPHDVRWHWVKGHAGHPENEQADALARGAIP